MQNNFALLCLAAVAIGPTGAGAVTPAAKSGHGQCKIVEGEKYLGVELGSSTICSAIERAIAAEAPAVAYNARIKVLSPSRLTAALVVNGRALPEHKFAVMDNNLSAQAVERFAQSLALAAADAAKR
jgi:hypothetical protein